MRRLRSLESPLSAGMPAMNDAIETCPSLFEFVNLYTGPQLLRAEATGPKRIFPKKNSPCTTPGSCSSSCRPLYSTTLVGKRWCSPRPAQQRRQPCRRRLLVRVIARPHQRTRLHMAEAHLERFCLELGKLARRVEPRHRQVIARRAQILADGQNVAAHRRQVAKNFKQLMPSLRPGPPSRRTS